MSEAERHDDFEARWAQAGLSPDERRRLGAALAAERELPGAELASLHAARARRRAAERRGPGRVLLPALAGLGLAVLAALLLFPRSPARVEPAATVAVPRDSAPAGGRLAETPAAGAQRPVVAAEPRVLDRPAAEAPRTVQAARAADADRPLAWRSRALVGGTLEWSEDSVVTEPAPRSFILARGVARVDVSGAPASPVLIEAGGLRVEALSAVFAVHVRDGVGSVRVYSGRVRVHERGAARGLDSRTPAVGPGATVLRVLEPWGRERGLARAVVRRPEGARPPAAAPPPPVVVAAPSAAAPVEPLPEPSVPRGVRPDPLPEILRAPPPVVRDESPRRAAEIQSYRRALALLRGGEAARAAEAFRAHLSRYPDGELVEEAELSWLEALFAAGERTQAEAQARAWLARHPGHPRGPEILRLLAGSTQKD